MCFWRLFGVVAHDPHVHLDIVGADSVAPKDYILNLSDDPKVQQLASFYGKRSYRDHLLAMLSPPIADRVSFLPWVPHSQLAEYYRAADVFIFPSVCNEAFGIPIIEAMASGVPVIVTRSGGVAEIVADGRTGLLVDRGRCRRLGRRDPPSSEERTLEKIDGGGGPAEGS